MINKLPQINYINSEIAAIRSLCGLERYKEATDRVLIISTETNSLCALRDQLPLPQIVMLQSAAAECLEILGFLDEIQKP